MWCAHITSAQLIGWRLGFGVKDFSFVSIRVTTNATALRISGVPKSRTLSCSARFCCPSFPGEARKIPPHSCRNKRKAKRATYWSEAIYYHSIKRTRKSLGKNASEAITPSSSSPDEIRTCAGYKNSTQTASKEKQKSLLIIAPTVLLFFSRGEAKMYTNSQWTQLFGSVRTFDKESLLGIIQTYRREMRSVSLLILTHD